MRSPRAFTSGILYLGLIGVGAVAPVELVPGPHAVGFRVEVLPAQAAAPAGQIHLWYPAAAACGRPLTYADYLRDDAQQPGQDVGAELRQGWSFDAPPLNDAQWARVTSATMRACRDAAPAAGRAPLLVALQLPGAWPVAAEFFASHGYAVAVVSRAGAPPAAADIVDRIAHRHREFVRDLRDAISQLSKRPDLDTARLGAVGQSHALLMLAMAEPSVRAVALHDSAFAAGRDADADVRSGLWQPAQFRAALLHSTTADRVPAETEWESFRQAVAADRRGEIRREVIAPKHVGHNDVTADGYLIRTRAPITAPPHDALIRAYEALLRAQRAFFDRALATPPRRRPSTH